MLSITKNISVASEDVAFCPQLAAGPFIHFLKEDSIKNLWHLAITAVIPCVDALCSLPQLWVTDKAARAIDGRVYEFAHDHLFIRYPLDVVLKEGTTSFSYSLGGDENQVVLPGKKEPAHMAAFSCNGWNRKPRNPHHSFYPMWRQVLNDHEMNPYHLMLGLGDQIYVDGPSSDPLKPEKSLLEVPSLSEWFAIENPDHRKNHPFTKKMEREVDQFYLKKYLNHFSLPEFSQVLATVPMLMNWDDHEIGDGIGSLPDALDSAPVIQGTLKIAKKYYLLFQHGISLKSNLESPFLKTQGLHFLKTVDGGKTAILGLDTRSHRTLDRVVLKEDWEEVLKNLKNLPKECSHLIVETGVPLAYPGVFDVVNLLEMIGSLSFINWFMKKVIGFEDPFGHWVWEDEVHDQWAHPAHLSERNKILEGLREIATEKKIRITLLSGDTHVASFGKIDGGDEDANTMWQVVTSPIANEHPPSIMNWLMNLRASVEQKYDEKTRFSMLPFSKEEEMFLLEKRNYLSLQQRFSDKSLEAALHVERSLADSLEKTYQLKIPGI